jgi:hypothetical protein
LRSAFISINLRLRDAFSCKAAVNLGRSQLSNANRGFPAKADDRKADEGFPVNDQRLTTNDGFPADDRLRLTTNDGSPTNRFPRLQHFLDDEINVAWFRAVIHEAGAQGEASRL